MVRVTQDIKIEVRFTSEPVTVIAGPGETGPADTPDPPAFPATTKSPASSLFAGYATCQS